MWSFAHNVNLLAAGGSIPFEGYSGSGIFSGRHGALNAIMSDVPVTKLLVAQVPKTPETEFNNLTTFKTTKKWKFISSSPSTILEKENIPDIQLAMLNFTQNRAQKGQLCHNDFCCQYDVEVFIHRLPPQAVRLLATILILLRSLFLIHPSFFHRYSIRMQLSPLMDSSPIYHIRAQSFIQPFAVWLRVPPRTVVTSSKRSQIKSRIVDASQSTSHVFQVHQNRPKIQKVFIQTSHLVCQVLQ